MGKNPLVSLQQKLRFRITAVISPISKIDDLETGKSYVFGDKPGPVSEKLFNKLRNIQYGIEPDTHNWTRVVIG